MYTKTLVRSAVACMAITLAAACGDSGSTGPNYDGTVTTADAEDAAFEGYQLASVLMAGIHQMEIGLSPEAAREKIAAQIAKAPARTVGEGRWRVTLDAARQFAAAVPAGGLTLVASPGCTSTESGVEEPGVPIDANENGFPDDWRWRMVCEVSEEGDGDTVYTGRQVLDLLMREHPEDLAGFELRVTQSQREQDNHGNFQEIEQKSELVLSVRSDRATHHQLTSIALRSHLPGETETSVLDILDRGDASYDPFSPIVLGNPIPDGELTLDGEVHMIDTEAELAIRFVLDTPEALEFDRACAEGVNEQPFIDGVLRGRLNGSNNIRFEVTFNSCGNEPDLETFGTDDGVPVSREFAVPPFRP